MNEQEKITDIITEKRLQADKLEKDLAQIDQSRVPLNIVTEMRMFIDSWRLEADRLEAAHKREAASHAMTCKANDRLREHLQIALDANKRERGDCAKMREVLLNIKGEAEHSYEYREYPIAGAPGEYGTCRVVDADWLIDECNKGLAAPPRNCDRFGGDYKKLNAAWFDWTGTPDGQNADGTVKLTFAEWLLAPATEKEGGNDGSK